MDTATLVPQPEVDIDPSHMGTNSYIRHEVQRQLAKAYRERSSLNGSLASQAKTRVTLRTIADLDQRTLAYRRARSLIDSIKSDLGIDDDGELTTNQRQLIQHAALLGAMCEDLAARWLAGEKIDQAAYSNLINTQRRILEAL
jgi:hypothetical protein